MKTPILLFFKHQSLFYKILLLPGKEKLTGSFFSYVTRFEINRINEILRPLDKRKTEAHSLMNTFRLL